MLLGSGDDACNDWSVLAIQSSFGFTSGWTVPDILNWAIRN